MWEVPGFHANAYLLTRLNISNSDQYRETDLTSSLLCFFFFNFGISTINFRRTIFMYHKKTEVSNYGFQSMAKLVWCAGVQTDFKLIYLYNLSTDHNLKTATCWQSTTSAYEHPTV